MRAACFALLLLSCAEPPRCPPALAPAPAPAPTPHAEAPAPPATGTDEMVKAVVAKMNAGDAKGVFAMFDDEMQKAVPLDKLQLMLAGIVEMKGKLGEPEKIEEKQGVTRYRVKAARGDWEIRAVAKGGRFAGLRFVEPTETGAPPPVVQSAIDLGLPFKGEWLVVWGGDTMEKNQHVNVPSQRRALDLVKVDAGGVTHKGDGKANTDFFAYGQDILAVADGTVVQVVDGVVENEPGKMNTYFVPGNLVIVEHQPKLYSVYAHLVPGKIKVKKGAKVKRGDVLGACGNSGNSSEPHLHFQLEDGPRLEDSWGVEIVFPSVKVNGTPAKAHVPMKDEKLSP